MTAAASSDDARSAVQVPDPFGLLLGGDLVGFLAEEGRLTENKHSELSISRL
jgi:hypothetical protein